jgi:Amt family ammonium transporter
MWVAVGYSLVFSGDTYGIIGNLDHAFLRGIPLTEITSTGIPLLVFIAYQMMFAIITPALITGAFVGRVRFEAYMIFLTAWLLCVYFPIAHMAWGGGLFAHWGVLDFAGGTVVHATAGFAALASVLFVGKRKEAKAVPHNIPFVALGTALLWFGWYGFNAGSELRADAITALAFLNTDIAASIAGLTWLLIVWLKKGRPSFIGLLSGAVAGLVAITPAAGYVTPLVSVIFGVIAGAGCYLAVEWIKKSKFDDALDVWGVHGVGGVLGVVSLGIFAATSANAAGANGLIFGNPAFFGVEVLSVVLATAWAFVFSYGALAIIDRFTPVRVSHEHEMNGLDRSLHGEEAYAE